MAKVRGINQPALVKIVRSAAEGRRVTKVQLSAAKYLLDKVLPNAKQEIGIELSPSGNTAYSEVTIRVLPGTEPAAPGATGDNRAQPEASPGPSDAKEAPV